MYKPKLVAIVVPIIIIVSSVVFYLLLINSPGLPSSKPQEVITEEESFIQGNQKVEDNTGDKKSIFSNLTGINTEEQQDRVRDAEQRAKADKLGLIIRSSLNCHFEINKKFPDTIKSLAPRCEIPSNVGLTNILATKDDYLMELKYKVTEDGQNYYFEVPAHDTTVVKVTNDSIETVDTSK